MRRDQDPVDDRPLIAALEDIRTRGAIGEASIVDAIAHADRFAALVPDEAIRLADLGSGGGLPGLVIGWRRPELRVEHSTRVPPPASRPGATRPAR